MTALTPFRLPPETAPDYLVLAGESIADRMSRIQQTAEQSFATLQAFPGLFVPLQDFQTSLRHFPAESGHLEVLIDSTFDITIRASGPRSLFLYLMRVLYASGFQGDKPKDKTTWYTSYWYHRDNDIHRVWLSYSSTTCQRVEVGRQTVEVPIYDIVCND